MDPGGLKPNTLQQFDRLSFTRHQARRGVADATPVAHSDDSAAVREPTRRTRTPLTAKEVDAIRTAKANGESVLSIAKRFDIHRMTVWTHTKNLP